MLKRSYRKILIFFFLFIILCVNSIEIEAVNASTITKKDQVFLQETSLSSCSNLDVIFIVDQSDSMSRNDPTENRKNAVIGMIDLLVDLAMNQCPDSHHRVGVISFGAKENSRVDIEMYDIDPVTASDARRIREDLRPRVMADNLGTTYPESAFIAAEKMFRQNELGDPEPRKRVVIFITDGLPCSPLQCEGADYNATTGSLVSLINDHFDFSDDLRERENCLSDVRARHPDAPIPADEATACLESYPVSAESYTKSTYIFTLLLHNSDEDYVPTAVRQLEAVSQEHGGSLSKNQRYNQIPTTLREILSQLVGVRPSLLRGPNFAVNPYLNKMIVTAYKQSADVQFTLSYTDAGGTTHTIQGGQTTGGFTLDPDNGYYVFEANEKYTILNPYPGIWNMSTSNPSGLDVYYEPIEASIQTDLFTEIPQYDRPPFYNESDPFYLKFKLTDSANNRAVVLQSDKEIFKIDVRAKVTDPDGHAVDYSLLWNPDSQSFRAEQPLQVPLAGAYKLSIVGSTLTHEGEPVIETANENQVFDKTTALFSVDTEFTGLDVIPIEFIPVSPEADMPTCCIHATIAGGWPLKTLSMPIRVRVTDENGDPFNDLDAVFVDPENAITAQLTYLPEAREGETPEVEEIGTIILMPDPTAPGEFVGEFSNSEYEGVHVLTLTVPADKLEQGYWPYNNETKTDFTRADCLLCRAGMYYGMLGAFIAFIVVSVVYNIAIRTNKISGNLVFTDGATEIHTFGLYSGTNTRRIKKRELDLYPQLMLKSMKARNAGKKRRPTAKQDDTFDTLFSEDQQGIEIECVSTSGRAFTVALHPKTPSIYSEDTFAQMVYEPTE
ncbi:MAG: VWA domain-containing protein [Chloroflexi bacterium]|nr:VWA domain-containing protein [Chloroflexota bacterium]